MKDTEEIEYQRLKKYFTRKGYDSMTFRPSAKSATVAIDTVKYGLLEYFYDRDILFRRVHGCYFGLTIREHKNLGRSGREIFQCLKKPHKRYGDPLEVELFYLKEFHDEIFQFKICYDPNTVEDDHREISRKIHRD